MKLRNILLILSILLTVISYSIMAPIEFKLWQNTNGGIINLQFAFTPKKGNEIIDSWYRNEPDGSTYFDDIYRNIYADFGFLIGYGMLLIAVGMFLNSKILILLPIFASGLDATENTLHLICIANSKFELIPIASAIAMLKFFSIALDLILLIILKLKKSRRRKIA